MKGKREVQNEEDGDAEKWIDAMRKTTLCKNWAASGTCRYGKKCLFAHGERELRPKPTLFFRGGQLLPCVGGEEKRVSDETLFNAFCARRSPTSVFFFEMREA